MYMGGGGAGADDSDASPGAGDGGESAPAAAASSAAAADPKLRSSVEVLRDRVDHLEAQLQQLEDRGREQAVGLASAVRETAGQGRRGEGDTAAEQRVQRQEEEQVRWRRRRRRGPGRALHAGGPVPGCADS